MRERRPDFIGTVAQAGIVVRLAALLLSALALGSAPAQHWQAVLVVILLAFSAYLLMREVASRESRGRHPHAASIDSGIMLASLLLVGPEHPMVLGAITTMLIVGMWLPPRGATALGVSVTAGYVASAYQHSGGRPTVTYALIVPGTMLAMVAVGMLIRRTVHDQELAQRAMEEALAFAAEASARTRFSREIHDSLAKSLQGVSLGASGLSALIETGSPRAASSAQMVADAATQAVADTRRLMTELRTCEVREPLADMVRQVALAWQRRTGRRVELEIDPGVEIDERARRYELLAVLGEALENVHKHAGPGAAATVTLAREVDRVVMEIKDDGAGASEEQVAAAQAGGHHGLRGMVERVAGIGGRMEWRSVVDEGSSVRFDVPERGLVER